MKGATAHTASFGPYALDSRSGELRKFGVRVKLGEQPLQILLMLLENQGELVTREDLRTKLWADDTFVDFDHGLNSAVQRLRDCLSDTAEEPQWVETVPRRGYRFIGQVQWSNGTGHPRVTGEVAPSAKEAPELVVATERRRPTILISTIVAIVLLAGCLVWLRAHRKTPQPNVAVSIRSVAVLPLENLSGDPSQDYFAAGMTDELITILAKNRALRITSGSSVMRYNSSHKPASEIGNELHVDAVIVGSVARSGNRLRVNAQLIRASDDVHLWSDSYERDLGDVLALQQELARTIAEQVRVTAQPPDSAPAGARAPLNPEAHDAYLRGRYYWFKGDYVASRKQFEKAIDVDPAYAAAYAGLADSYIAQSGTAGMPVEEGVSRGEVAARKALEIDSSLAEAYLSLSSAKFFFRWDWPGAEVEIKRAIQLNPSLAEAHHLYDYILSVTNRFPEAIEQEKIAQQLDPFNRPWAMGRQLYRQRKFDEAIQELRSQIAIQPQVAGLHSVLANAYFFKGMSREGLTESEKALTLAGQSDLASTLENVYKSGGYEATLRWQLDELLKKKAKNEYVSPFDLAELSNSLGRRDDAVHYLQEALNQRLGDLVHLKQDPYFDSLHSDARFQAIVKEIGLP
jgi:TolB-like protein/DNA-binding winged helix-turn-helix (wHTH) protein